MSNLLMWIVAVFMIAIGSYTGYINWTTWKKAKDAKARFLQNNPGAKTVLVSRSRPWWFAALAALSLGLSLFITVANLDFKPAVRYSQVFVYLGLGIFSLAMVGQALTDSEIVYSQDAFMLVTEPIRFRNVNKVEVTKGILSPCTMTLAGNKEEVLPKTVARWLSAQLQTWKKEKKAAKRAPRGRQK